MCGPRPSGRRERAESILAAQPELEHDPWVKLVLGREWDGDPNTPGGPRGWAPLLYACHSCFPTTGLARDLLARGADPNGYFVNEYGNMSALYGAAGIRHDPELTRALLEAGANPNDGESLYHSTEAESPDCLRILLEHGARRQTRTRSRTPSTTSAWSTSGCCSSTAPTRTRARASRTRSGAGAGRRRSSCWSRTAPMSTGRAARPGAATCRCGRRTSTPSCAERTSSQSVLAQLGASTELDPADAAVASIARGERPTTPLPETLDPDAQEVIVLSAQSGKLDLVLDVVGPHFRGVVFGSPAGTLLHHAAWIGSVGERGAAARAWRRPRGASPLRHAARLGGARIERLRAGR